MNYEQLFQQLPWAAIFGLIATWGIPYLSALATKKPGWWTGILTTVLAFADAVFVQLGQHGIDNVHWKAVVGLSFGYTASAWLHHVVAIKGTEDVQPWLHAHGNKYSGNPQPQAGYKAA